MKESLPSMVMILEKSLTALNMKAAFLKIKEVSGMKRDKKEETKP